MSKTGLLCLILLIGAFGTPVRAQQVLGDDQLDSLERLLRAASADTVKAVVLQEISDYWLYKDSAKAMDYAMQIFHLSKKNAGVAHLPGIAHYQVGGVYLVYQDLDKAEKHYLQAFSVLENKSSKQALLYLARTWHDYGAIYQRKGEEKKFLDILLNKSIPILENLQDSIRLAFSYHDVGSILMNVKQWDKAQEYYEKAIDILRHYPRYEMLVDAHLNAAFNLMNMEDDSREQVRKISKHLGEARGLLSSDLLSPAWLLYYRCNGAFCQYYLEEPDRALENYDKGLDLARKLKNEPYREMELLNRKFYLHYDQGEYELAKKAVYENYRMSKEFSMGTNQRIALKNMADVEEKSGNIRRAYMLLGRLLVVSDSLQENETKLKINELEKKFQEEKKENEILQLRSENDQQELKLQRSNFWTAVSASAALLIAVGFIAGLLLYRGKQQMTRQKEQLHKQEVDKLRKEQKLSNFSAMLEGQEQERKRLAAELHDGLGGSLAGIKLKLSKAMGENGLPEPNGHLPVILSQLDGSIDELRRIARNLMPETLLRFGLITALEEFCSNMGSWNERVIFQAYGVDEDTMSPTTCMMLYRITQELVANAVKHAKASQVLVQLIQDGSKIILTVEDDGLGFNTSTALKRQGLGLSTVKTRTEYLNGYMELDSEPGTGTTINIEIDLERSGVLN